jgi:BioD-like phosphotransacetylase family protein
MNELKLNKKIEQGLNIIIDEIIKFSEDNDTIDELKDQLDLCCSKFD